MSKPYYKILNKADKEADILLYGVIGTSWWEESVTAKRFVMDFKELEKTCTRINIHINSPGGSVFDGLAIFNTVQQSKTEIHTYNDGMAASMGAVILCAGGTVHTAKNALMMLHAPMGGAYGTAKDIQNYLTILDKVKNSLISCLESKTGKKTEDIEKAYFDFNDHWLTADEAKKEGFVDEIEEKEVKLPENITSMAYSDIVNQFDDLMSKSPKSFNVVSWFNNFFTNKTDDEMNLSELIKVCNLDAKSSETQVLEHIKNLVSGHDALKADKEKAEGDLKAEQDAHAATTQKLTEANSQIENLKTGPGATSPDVTKPTDATTQEETEGFLNEKDVELFNKL